jgi:membrane protein YqaA with SNARE-associated domain
MLRVERGMGEYGLGNSYYDAVECARRMDAWNNRRLAGLFLFSFAPATLMVVMAAMALTAMTMALTSRRRTRLHCDVLQTA